MEHVGNFGNLGDKLGAVQQEEGAPTAVTPSVSTQARLDTQASCHSAASTRSCKCINQCEWSLGADRNQQGSRLQCVHGQIRSSIAQVLKLEERFGIRIASAITLACHPWPDIPIGEQTRQAIAVELLPGFNVNHPNPLEVATDRLLRIAESLHFTQAPDLALQFAEAAQRLIQEAIGAPQADERVAMFGVISSPWGGQLVEAGFNGSVACGLGPVNEAENSSSKWKSIIASLLGGAYEQGSRDVGVICRSAAVNVTVDEVAAHLGVEVPETTFDRFLSGLSSRKIDILKSRRYKLRNPDTLIEVASRWGITRERVRQIESRISARLHLLFAETFTKIGRQAILPFTIRLAKASDLNGVALEGSRKSRFREILAGFLLECFGPWESRGKWIIHKSLSPVIDVVIERLTEGADSYGFLNSETLTRECEPFFFDADERNEFLTEVVGFGMFFGHWTVKSTHRCQLLSALKTIGRPATKDELAELMDIPSQRVGSMLGSLDCVVRADRFRWGFPEWVDDVYDGIVGEIEQRIDAYHNSVPMHVLLSEIPSQFDVTEGSVKAYLASPAFIVENGMVRRARLDEYVPNHPAECREAVRLGNRWAHRCVVHERHFHGYSLGVHFDIAYANGLRPGDDLLVPLEGCNYQVSLIWRSHNLNRLVDVGRISNYLKAEGYKAGDVALIIPGRESAVVMRNSPSCESSAKDSTEGRAIEGDLTSDRVSDPLLDLLGDD